MATLVTVRDAAADAFGTALAGHDIPILVFLYTGLGQELQQHPRWPGLLERMSLPVSEPPRHGLE